MDSGASACLPVAFHIIPAFCTTGGGSGSAMAGEVSALATVGAVARELGDPAGFCIEAIQMTPPMTRSPSIHGLRPDGFFCELDVCFWWVDALVPVVAVGAFAFASGNSGSPHAPQRAAALGEPAATRFR